MSKITTTVIDAGGRYGLHPTWKPFSGELNYFLFEPDPIESKRLRKKYEHRSSEIKIVDKAITKDDGHLTINFFRNRAMSSSVTRHPVSALFKGERLNEVDIVESINVESVSIDSFSKKNQLEVDFLKLDTEGTEFSILEGSQEQLKNTILGVRSEVAFDRIFEDMPLFGDVNDFLLDQGFYLLNIDYDGKGDYQNDFVKSTGRYGILTASDAVWMRRFDSLFNPKTDSQMLSTNVLKYAAFCINNYASDVALDVLFKARKEMKISFEPLQTSRLYKFVDIQIQKHFYGLKWQPGQSLKNCQNAYFDIFEKKMKEVNEFMESLELNPD